jgi:hypothetical protein
MTGFGAKQAWLAIRDRSPEAVIASLGLRDLGPVAWSTGLELAHTTDDRLAMTPPLPGADGSDWVLVPGRYWLGSPPKVAVWSGDLDTEVQFFATYRVGERHRWERAVDGILARGFAYVGESGEVTLWWGDPDEHERALGLPAEEPDDDDLDILLGEADVLRLAAAWSVDPSALDGRPAPGPLRVVSFS